MVGHQPLELTVLVRIQVRQANLVLCRLYFVLCALSDYLNQIQITTTKLGEKKEPTLIEVGSCSSEPITD